MGLDTTHDAWHGPYSSFNRFRTWIAKQINIELHEMDGFGGSKEWDDSIDLYPLLYHSDCDGELTVEESKRIVKGIDDLMSNLDESQRDEYMIEKLNQFKRGCELAISKNEIIEFG